MDDLNYSRRNCPYFRTTSQNGGEKLGEYLYQYEAYRREKGEKTLSQEHRTKYQRHIEIVLLDLLSCWNSDPRKYIGYSRGKAAFTKGGSYWDAKNGAPLLSQRLFLGVIDAFEALGLVENHKAEPGREGISSRMRATPQLAKELGEADLNWATIVADQDAPTLIIKDENKNVLPFPEQVDFDVAQAEENLKRINENLQSTYINLHISDDAHKALLERMKGNEEEGGNEPREPIEFSNRFLRRVFRDDFSTGGRFYGGWWQGVPSELRKHIVIDGAVTREMDFSTMAPRIMYAKVREQPPRDSYLPDGWDDEVRPISKKTFNRLINSHASSRNEGQWHRFAPSIDPDPRPDNWSEMQEHQRYEFRRNAFMNKFGRPYSDLIRDLIQMHQPIDQYLFSGAWGEMQRIDSDIAEQVMIRMLNKEVPVTVLPIHDSFIVRRGGEDDLFYTMAGVFEEVVGVPCDIKLDDAVYDAPEGYESPGLVNAGKIWDAVVNEMNEMKEYHIREAQWVRAHGPVIE